MPGDTRFNAVVDDGTFVSIVLSAIVDDGTFVWTALSTVVDDDTFISIEAYKYQFKFIETNGRMKVKVLERVEDEYGVVEEYEKSN